MGVKHFQVSTTTSTRDEAERIATQLVEGRLAACVQILGPVTSVYRWQGAIERAEEWLCLVKTTTESYRNVEQAIRTLHTYECPEIIAVPIAEGSADYLAWVDMQVGGGGLNRKR